MIISALKKTFPLLCFLILQFSSTRMLAQKFEVNLSEKQQLAENGLPYIKMGDEFIGLDIDGSRPLGRTANRYKATIVRFDQKLTVVKKNELSAGEKIYGEWFFKIKRINNKIWFFYYEHGNSLLDVFKSLMVVEINPTTLETSTPRMIATVLKEAPNGTRIGRNTTLDILSSADQKRTMVYMNFADNKVFLTLLDENLNVLWSKTDEVAGKGKIVPVLAYLVSDSGHFYFAHKVWAGKAYDDYEVRIYKQENEVIRKKLPMAHNPVTVSFLQAKSVPLIYVAGAYRKNSSRITGMYKCAVKIDDGNIVDFSERDLPADFVKQLVVDRWGSLKKDYGLDKYEQGILELADGTLTLVGEFRAVTEDQGFQHFTPYYAAGSLLVVYFDSIQPVFARVPKLRNSTGSGIPRTYITVPLADKIIFLYNDFPGNLRRDIKREPEGYDNVKEQVLAAAIMERDGTVKRETVLDMAKKNFTTHLYEVWFLSPTRILLALRNVRSFGGFGDQHIWATIEIK